MMLSLFKPEFYWGPPAREERIKRKQFTPRTAIRSQPIRHIKEGFKKRNKFRLVDDEFSDEIAKSRLFSDTQFFRKIGVRPDQIKVLTKKSEIDEE